MPMSQPSFNDDGNLLYSQIPVIEELKQFDGELSSEPIQLEYSFNDVVSSISDDDDEYVNNRVDAVKCRIASGIEMFAVTHDDYEELLPSSLDEDCNAAVYFSYEGTDDFDYGVDDCCALKPVIADQNYVYFIKASDDMPEEFN
jgi:hypothetical protein